MTPRDTHYIPRICRECADGKHRNCDGYAWNDKTDEIDTCECDQRECAT